MKHPHVYDMLLRGYPPRKIVKETGLSRQTVYSIRCNYEMPTSRELQDIAVVRMFEEGKTDEEIAAELGLAVQTVRISRSRMALKRRPNHRARLLDADWSKSNLTISQETGAPYSSVVYWRSVHEKANR